MSFSLFKKCVGCNKNKFFLFMVHDRDLCLSCWNVGISGMYIGFTPKEVWEGQRIDNK